MNKNNTLQKIILVIVLGLYLSACTGSFVNDELEQTVESSEQNTENLERLLEEERLSEGLKFLTSEIQLRLCESERRDVHILLAEPLGTYEGVWRVNNECYSYFEMASRRDANGEWDYSLTKSSPHYYTEFPDTWDYFANEVDLLAEITGWVKCEIPEAEILLQRRKGDLFEEYICRQALGYIAELYEDHNGTVEGVLRGEVYVLTDPFDDPYSMEAEAWYCVKDRDPVKATLKFDRTSYALLAVTIDKDAVYAESEVEKAIVTLSCDLTINKCWKEDGLLE